jgi:4-amino-4-deoxy-L-arabinose transferase-like glycosyltransferase
VTRGQPAGSGRLSRLTVTAILALYLVLVLIYNSATPIFEASDEFRHYLTIRYLALNHHLPVLQPSDDPFAPWQEAGQPPLYYLAGAALTGWVDTGDIAEADFNPHAEAGVPSTTPNNKNLFVHAPSEDFPYHGVSLAAHLARLLSMVLGAGTVYFTWRLARTIAPGSLPLALLATSLVAFNPQFLFVSASVDNDNLITLASTAALLLMVQILLRGLSARRLWLLSVVLGAAMLSKLSGLGLPPLAAAVVGVRAPRPSDWRKLLRPLAVLAAGPVALAGWWFVRNWAIYGEPTGLRAWAELVHTRAPNALEVVREIPGLFLSYWGVFGAFDIQAEGWVYVVYLGLCAAGAAGFLRARKRIGTELPSWGPIALLAAWFGLELIALLRWTTVASASTGRLLFPAVAAVAIILGLGLLTPLRPGGRWPAAIAVSALLLALAAYLPFRYIFPAYARPEVAPSAAIIGQPSHPAHIDYAGKLQLLGYDLSPQTARPGDGVTVGLYWRVLEDIEQNYSVTVQLLTAGLEVQSNTPCQGQRCACQPAGARAGACFPTVLLAGQYDSFPGQGRIATRHLRAGEYFHDTYRVRVASTIQPPVIARLKVGLYEANLTKLTARDASGAELAEPIAGELLIERAVGPPPSRPAPVATFGEDMQLLSASVSTPSVRPGEDLTVALRWFAAKRMAQSYTVFVHLAADSGRPIAQHDSQPREGAFPTTLWAAGQTIDDAVRLPVPLDVPPGRYQLLVGVYDSTSLQRLPTSTGGDSFRVDSIDVL